MPEWEIRDFDRNDLDEAVKVWDESHTTDERPLFTVAEVIDSLAGGEPALVAVQNERIVGTVVARVTGERAWILRIAIHPDSRHQGIGSALLRGIEDRLVRAGVRRIASLLPAGEVGHEAFENQDYRLTSGVEYFEKLEPGRPVERGVLAELGAQRITPERWDSLLGMREAKELIERKILLPLASPAVAERHGVQLPHAVILFGPPGTGKTTFAKAVAGRLGWPFVEIFPSRLAADGRHGRASALREIFEKLREIEHVVAFIDEVDEIAGRRTERRDTEGVTNELLKAIPSFRETAGRLLVCATNAVRDLDSAFLRPGRFDFILPIGPPDGAARRSLFEQYAAGITPLEVDGALLAALTELYTTADVELVARKAAQMAFERSIAEGTDRFATTEDFKAAVTLVRSTLSREQIAEFDNDISRFARW